VVVDSAATRYLQERPALLFLGEKKSVPKLSLRLGLSPMRREPTGVIVARDIHARGDFMAYVLIVLPLFPQDVLRACQTNRRVLDSASGDLIIHLGVLCPPLVDLMNSRVGGRKKFGMRHAPYFRNIVPKENYAVGL